MIDRKIPVACRYYLKGQCIKKSSDCRFLHDKTAPVSLLCSKFISGYCEKDKCRFIHYKPSFQNIELQNEEVLCRFFYEYGRCRRGLNCPHIHGRLCSNCALYAIYPNDFNGELHKKICENAKASMIRRYSEPSISKSCIICHGNIVEQLNRFAIMQSCNHVFCAPCIKRWRATTAHSKDNTKSCPICRVISFQYIPSDYWIDDINEKQKLFQHHRQIVSQKLCRYLKNDPKWCPFGSNCIYSHSINSIEFSRGKPGVKPKNLSI
uniref:RING-type E3 ubiquitin transferase n=1 Tax=Panagrolaimus sp. PS1159 TaxID=55785 RepID=A0AC35FX66_9BILA